ncbi:MULTISPECIES: hypothetical protein [unclassified Amycolatopsis]|uniref:hypothetical protein n=1 Tax=unclassified Amycolatopsis TaxID=2618356 RepID=UPI001431A339|nr:MULTISPECIES: hypothetical protein [unclassified Amycolatopsis]
MRSSGERARERGVRRVDLRRVLLLVRLGELLARMHRPGLLRCPMAGLRWRARLPMRRGNALLAGLRCLAWLPGLCGTALMAGLRRWTGLPKLRDTTLLAELRWLAWLRRHAQLPRLRGTGLRCQARLPM